MHELRRRGLVDSICLPSLVRIQRQPDKTVSYQQEKSSWSNLFWPPPRCELERAILMHYVEYVGKRIYVREGVIREEGGSLWWPNSTVSVCALRISPIFERLYSTFCPPRVFAEAVPHTFASFTPINWAQRWAVPMSHNCSNFTGNMSALKIFDGTLFRSFFSTLFPINVMLSYRAY